MNVAFIGSGNVATQMAIAFKKAGYPIAGIWSRNPGNAQLLAAKVNAPAITALNEVPAASLYIIAIKDDEIAEITAQLNIGDGVVAHTSGATGISVFEGKFKNYGVFYPLQTFSKEKPVNFSEIPLCIEANNTGTEALLYKVAASLSNKIYKINSAERQILHLAAVFACNFTNHLYALSNALLKENVLGFEMLRPLIRETADKVLNALPTEVQTGPAVRGDAQTMDKHLEMLKQYPQLRDIYILLSESIKKATS